MRWLLVALFTTVAAFAAGQNVTLPEGDGKAMVAASCGGCHGMDLVTSKAAARADWASTVERMKTYGATLNAEQTTTVVDYLAKSFPPKGAAPAQAAGAAAGGDDAEAKALVNGVCASCHGADLTTARKADKNEWQGIVDRMKGYGANLTAAQTTTLVDYLAKAYGTGPAPAPAPAAAAAAAPGATAAAAAGKKLMEDYCGGCHDLDLVTGRKGSQSEWQEIVDRMNGRGAGVPDKDIPAIVQFLTTTYGVK